MGNQTVCRKGADMFSRRLILTQAIRIAGASMASSFLPTRAAVPEPSRRLRAISAGQVRVSHGPWPALPQMTPGVYLENLYLTMPDGVRLNAFLYLPSKARPSRLPALL